MVKVARVLGMVLAIGLAFGAASAAEIADGAKELAFGFSYADTADVATSLDLSGRLGWFLSPANELGVVASYFDISIDGPGSTGDTDGGAGGIFYRYNFRTGGDLLVPFVGAQMLWPIGDLSDVIDYSLGLELGTRFMVGDSASVNLAAFYQEDYGASGFSDTETLGILAGISIFFGNQ